MDPVRRELVDVLRECRALLAHPDSDYLWSSWEDADAALEEIDGMIAAIEQGEPLSRWWSVIFAPTGPMQEVAISSGWGDAFLALANRWDAAMEVAKGLAQVGEQCRCMTPPPDHRDYVREELGVDEGGGRYADVAIERCKYCGRPWLRYHYEIEAFTGSGRWYRGLVTPEQAARATPHNALEILASLPWHLYGGSYFETTGKRSDVPLDPATV
ncbi:MAG: hypothetical protein ACJ8J0_12585 [Longimicrobiaceae bacterium]